MGRMQERVAKKLPTLPSHSLHKIHLHGTKDLGELFSEFTGMHKDHAMRARHLRAVEKINLGEFNITKEETQELYDFLDTDGSGELEFSEVASLFQMVLVPPCTDREIRILWELTDQSKDGNVSVAEVHRILTSSVFAGHYTNMRNEIEAAKMLQAHIGLGVHVTREFLVDRVNWSVNRDDAFRTLPYSITFLCVFIAAVIGHLQVWEKQAAERDVQNYVVGYGLNLTGPYLMSHVYDWSGMWDWLELSFIPLIFGQCANATGSIRCPVAATSLLVGDVRLQCSGTDGPPPQPQWLLDSGVARAHLLREPLDLVGAALARLGELRASGWGNQMPSTMSINFITLSESLAHIAVTEAMVQVDAEGLGYGMCVTHVTPLDPYAKHITIAVDVLYMALLLYPLYCELRDLLTGIRLIGIVDGCKSYWSLWNLVDWVSITCGVANIIVWVQYCIGARDHIVLDLLEDPSGPAKLHPRAMELGGARLAAVEEHLHSMTRIFVLLKYIMAFNILSIMLKFFKASHSNPRLQLVTNTLARAFEDISHFGFVLVAIFVGFSLIGHILFGGDIPAFNTFAQACSTAVLVLHGEFGWFRDKSTSDKGLSSGTPWTIVVLWFYLFVIFVFLVTLNMLLAIIMDHYLYVVHLVRQHAEAPTVWRQAWSLIKRTWAQQGYIPMGYLQAQLTDEAAPAHPEAEVTAASLQQAFPGMHEEQAFHIMAWLQKEALAEVRRHALDSESAARLKELSMLGRSLCQQVRMIALIQQKGAERVRAVGKLRASQEKRVRNLEVTLAALETHLTALSDKHEVLWGRPDLPQSARQVLWPPPVPFGPPEPDSDDAGIFPAPPPPMARGTPAPPTEEAPLSRRMPAQLPPCWLATGEWPAGLV